MSGNLFINWAALALSFFNAILLFWLCLTILLNADRRAWGLWLAGAGMSLGGIFFLSHAAILDRGLIEISLGMIFWWTVGLVPALALPYAWYIVVLWYAGMITGRRPRRGQQIGLVLTTGLLLAGLVALLLGIVLIADLFLFNPILPFFRLAVRWSVWGMPLLALGYSLYVFLCIGLAIAALLQPGPTERVMGGPARDRARPWLIAVSAGLILVSLLGVGALLRIVQGTRGQTFMAFYQTNNAWIVNLDLFITALIAVIILLLGQAVVAYEIFTGKSLPRRGLVRRWRQAILLAAGYGLLIGGSVAINLRLIYSLLLTALLMTLFFALFSWRTFYERDRFMANLRPFVSSQRLFEQLLERSDTPAVADIQAPFSFLCTDILNARFAYLGALGPLAPLVGAPLAFPGPQPALGGRLVQIGQRLGDLLPASMGGFLGELAPELAQPPLTEDTWVVPLAGERGLIGLLLLGPKRGDEFYTQEEIEIAQASSERLIDARASTLLAGRLMTLQRQRLQQSQIADNRTRRLLHDDILPYLHTALLALSEERESNPTAVKLLTQAHKEISNLLRELPAGALPEIQRLGLIGALRQLINGEMSGVFDAVHWQVAPDAAEQFDQLPMFMTEVLFYAAREALRNAGRHGRGRQKEKRLEVTLIAHAQNGLQLVLQDNGVGLANSAAAWEQAAGGGSGQGLALHSTMMAVIGGTLAVESDPGVYTRVTLQVL